MNGGYVSTEVREYVSMEVCRGFSREAVPRGGSVLTYPVLTYFPAESVR
jgi:hypothetical protein